MDTQENFRPVSRAGGLIRILYIVHNPENRILCSHTNFQKHLKKSEIRRKVQNMPWNDWEKTIKNFSFRLHSGWNANFLFCGKLYGLKYKENRLKSYDFNRFLMVRVTRFELAASWTPFKRDTKLRHTRKYHIFYSSSIIAHPLEFCKPYFQKVLTACGKSFLFCEKGLDFATRLW